MPVPVKPSDRPDQAGDHGGRFVSPQEQVERDSRRVADGPIRDAWSRMVTNGSRDPSVSMGSRA